MFVSNRKIRVLIAGDEDESHRTEEIAKSLREAGMDVIDSGCCATAETIVADAAKFDVDVVSLSLTDISRTVCQQLMRLLHANSMDDCLVVACDASTADAALDLEYQGVSKAFPLGAPANAVVQYLHTHVRAPWTLPENPQAFEIVIT